MPVKTGTEELSDELYYHGFLPRHDVEEMLKSEGDYLVRTVEGDGKSEKRQVVSVMWNGEHKHILIKRTKTKGTFYIKLYEFDDIPKLIRFYSDRKMPLNDKSGAKLLTAVPRQEWELLHEQIKLRRKIGAGAYGSVHLGTLRLSRAQMLDVAVKLHHMDTKQPSAKAQLNEIMREARLLRQYEHSNIVRFYGVAAKEQPLMIVMELVPGGSLDKFIKTYAKRLTWTDRISFSLDAARGLEYLHGKNCIHRDIAARNCLIDRNYLVKISDFGLSQQESTGSFKQIDVSKVPVRWLAPEVFKDSKMSCNRSFQNLFIFVVYTKKTDVYSYSILVYEIFSDVSFPYRGKSVAEVKKFVKSGGRLTLPPSTPESMQTLVAQCWHQYPEERPEFGSIVKDLEEILKSSAADDVKKKRKAFINTVVKLGDAFVTGVTETASDTPPRETTSGGGEGTPDQEDQDKQSKSAREKNKKKNKQKSRAQTRKVQSSAETRKLNTGKPGAEGRRISTAIQSKSKSKR